MTKTSSLPLNPSNIHIQTYKLSFTSNTYFAVDGAKTIDCDLNN